MADLGLCFAIDLFELPETDFTLWCPIASLALISTMLAFLPKRDGLSRGFRDALTMSMPPPFLRKGFGYTTFFLTLTLVLLKNGSTVALIVWPNPSLFYSRWRGSKWYWGVSGFWEGFTVSYFGWRRNSLTVAPLGCASSLTVTTFTIFGTLNEFFESSIS